MLKTKVNELEWILLLAAGFFGGILNSVAGGGSFITFPTLLYLGVPPIVANATNTLASCAGYLSGTYGFRQDLAKQTHVISYTLVWSLLGGAIGAVLLLTIGESNFERSIPWLLLFASLLFIGGGKIRQWVVGFSSQSQSSTMVSWVLLTSTLVAVSAYGGFFNAGLGVIVLSYLVLAGYTDINQMNGLKLMVSSSVSVVAIVIFTYEGVIDWPRGLVMMIGNIAGGYAAARISRRLPQKLVFSFVACSSLALTLYFFIDIYQ